MATDGATAPPPNLPDGARPSPNIWHHPATYEIENRAVDPDRVIEGAMASIGSWDGRAVLDLGCGTGFHLPRFAATAAEVVGVEPHPDLLKVARRRVRRLGNVRVLQGTAQDIPLAASSVDVVHARWAYFFGPGCEPGLHELDRVVRRGAVAFVIDNDATRSTFGAWLRRGYPNRDPRPIERFWTDHGWHRTALDIRWEFGSRADFECVVRIEFPPDAATAILSEHASTGVDYAVNLWWRHF
ncbi:MAG: class I SAM-dependent methyltransferase [Nocardioides sp.]